MNQDIDIQAQREGESDRAYLAYTIYRDMGASRTERGAYALYIKQINPKKQGESVKVGSPSGSHARWVIEYDWAGRVKDWEAQKQIRIHSAQLEADRQGYTKRIEDNRAILERTATMGLKSAEISLAIGFGQLQRIAKKSVSGALTKPEVDLLAAITKNNKDSIDTLAAAKTEIYDALGLVQIIERFTDGSN